MFLAWHNIGYVLGPPALVARTVRAREGPRCANLQRATADGHTPAGIMVLCEQMGAMAYELLISDCDGVLVDSEILADQVMREALASFVPSAPLEHLLETTFGQTTREVLRRVEERFALQLPETLLAQIQARSEA